MQRKVSLLVWMVAMTICLHTLHAQSHNINIQGVLKDTFNEVLPGATVLLLDPSDTSLLSYARTENDGSFKFNGVKRMRYLIKATYLAHIPYLADVNPKEDKLIDLGVIKLKPLANELMEVVIKAAKAPLTIRGDTIEYDASTFKVPPGSTVEDLLRRLPGIEVGQDGSIKSEGRDVTKVTVDGKKFFGADPKAATKNLPAEGITKVQIFDEETEEKKLTGVSSTMPDKVMNLALKDEFKKGSFGKVTAGGGTENTYEFKGNINKFNDKEQFSIIGNVNTTGRNGLSWNDYQDFKGSGADRWDDGGTFGFGSGRRWFSISFAGDDDDDSGGDSFFSEASSGFPKNYKGGANYNFDNNKNQATATYFYSRTGLYSDNYKNGKTFLPDATLNNIDHTTNDKLNGNHEVNLSLDTKIDSLSSVKINLDGNFVNQNKTNKGLLSLLRQEGDEKYVTNTTFLNNSSENSAFISRLNAIYRKKFRKKGRSFGISSGVSYSKNDRNATQNSTNSFFNESGAQDSVISINQLHQTLSDRKTIDANTMYTEPLSKKFFWSTFYNFNYLTEKVDRDVTDVLNGSDKKNDFLSRYYNNDIMTNRLGTFLRYSWQGTNISLGIARQRLDLSGNYESGPSAGIKGTVDKVFYNWLPNFNMSFDLRGNKYINTSYSVDASAPSIKRLQPIVDNSNPLYITVGNPDLKPEIGHSVSIGFNKFNPANFIRLSLHSGFTYTEDQIISYQQVTSSNVTTSRFINYSGGQNLWTWTSFGFPIIKNKFTVNLSYNPGYSRSFAFVNNVLNKTNSFSNNGSVRINITPDENLSIYLNASLGHTDTKYNINSSQNQQTLNQNYNLEFNTKLFWGIFLNTSFSYNKFENQRYGFDRDIPLLNLSLYKFVLKGNKGEVRVSLYDAFNKNEDINQYTGFNTVTQSSTTALARYAMLSFSYNIRGMKANKESNFWW